MNNLRTEYQKTATLTEAFLSKKPAIFMVAFG